MCIKHHRQIVYVFSFLFLGNAHLLAFENMTFQKLLEKNYKNCELVKENIFLTKTQQQQVEKKLKMKVSSLHLRYKNSCNDSYIYIDSHIVRTQNETLVVEIAKNKIALLEIASFMEPQEYIPPKKWLSLFKDNNNQEVDALTGATLSENAIRKVVKKLLIMDTVINDKV